MKFLFAAFSALLCTAVAMTGFAADSQTRSECTDKATGLKAEFVVARGHWTVGSTIYFIRTKANVSLNAEVGIPITEYCGYTGHLGDITHCSSMLSGVRYDIFVKNPNTDRQQISVISGPTGAVQLKDCMVAP